MVFIVGSASTKSCQPNRLYVKQHCGFEVWATETFAEFSGTLLYFDVNICKCVSFAHWRTITLTNPISAWIIMNLHESVSCCMSRRPVFIYPAKKSEYVSRLIGATGHSSREVVKHRWPGGAWSSQEADDRLSRGRSTTGWACPPGVLHLSIATVHVVQTQLFPTFVARRSRNNPSPPTSKHSLDRHFEPVACESLWLIVKASWTITRYHTLACNLLSSCSWPLTTQKFTATAKCQAAIFGSLEPWLRKLDLTWRRRGSAASNGSTIIFASCPCFVMLLQCDPWKYETL